MKNLILLSMLAAALAAGVSLADYATPGAFDGRTLDLWQMDQYNGTAARINGESGDNGLWLMLYNHEGNPSVNDLDFTSLIGGPTAAFGNALSFADNTGLGETDPVEAYAKTRLNAWEGFPYVKIGMWVKVTELNRMQFIAKTSAWRIWVENGSIKFLTFFNDGSHSGSQAIDISAYQEQWLYVTSLFDDDGTKSLNVKNLDGSFDQTASDDFPGKVLKAEDTQIVIASDGGVRRHFSGAIDNLRVSRPEIVLEHESPAEDTAVGGVGLWHLDEETDDITPDDNSMDVYGRDLPLELKGGTSLVTPADYPAGDSAFDKCAEFNGMGNYITSTAVPNINTSNFNVEFWMKMDPGLIPGDTQQVTGPKWIAQLGSSFRIYLQVNEDSVSLQFRVDPITENILSENIALNGKWNHYRLSFVDGEMEMYENGGMIGSTTANTESVPEAANTLQIGAYGASDRFFWGWLDDIHIYGDTQAQCGDFGYLDADINEDCYVDISDLRLLVGNWLDCTFEGDPSCDNLN